MRIKSWFETCSSSANCATATNHSIPKLRSQKQPQHAADSSTSSDSTTTSLSHDSNSTLHSNDSIQTLPSIPSLQKVISLLNSNFSLSYHNFASLKPHPSRPVTSLALHANLLYAATDHQINVYDRHTCINLHTFNSQATSSGSTKTITFSNNMIFTTHQDRKIRVWHHRDSPHKNHHRMLTALPTVKDRFLRFLIPKNYVNVRRHEKRLWIEHVDAVTDIAISNGVIYSVSWDKTLKIWRVSDLRCVESIEAHEDAVNAVVVSNEGTVYTGSADRRIRVWGKPCGEKRHVLVASLEKHKSAVNALALNDDDSVLFSGACDRSILVWEREDSANHMVVSGALRGHQKAILCLINVSDLLLSGSADQTVRIWKRAYDGSFYCLGVLDGHRKPVKSLAAIQEHDESSLDEVVSVFSGSLDGEIKVWQFSIKNLAATDQELDF